MSIEHEDLVVYAHPDGITYLAIVEQHGWVCWPAERNGWQQRAACPASLVDSCEELDPLLGMLALRLSGVVAP